MLGFTLRIRFSGHHSIMKGTVCGPYRTDNDENADKLKEKTVLLHTFFKGKHCQAFRCCIRIAMMPGHPIFYNISMALKQSGRLSPPTCYCRQYQLKV